MTMPSRGGVLLIGAGRMGGALLKGWIGAHEFSNIHVVEPAPTPELRRLSDDGTIGLHGAFGDGIPQVAAIVLAIKPQTLKNAAGLLKALGKRDALILSIAAGVTTSFLGASMGPVPRLVRAMPNTPGSIGRGITALYAEEYVTAAERASAERLMASLGQTLWLPDEGLMDAATAVSGSGPAYIFLLVEALAAAGRAQGLDEAVAGQLARATVAGAGALLDADKRAASELRKEVTSPGGTTEAALEVLLVPDGLESLLRRAVDAATKRGRDLGKS